MTKNQNDKTQNDELIKKINNLPEVIVDLIKG